MSKSITYQIYSQDPKKYNTVSFNPTIPWNTFKVEYKVINVNTFSNFLITTKDDFITIEEEFPKTTIRNTYKFTDKSSYDIDELAQMLTNMFSDMAIIVDLNDSGVLDFSGNTGILKITDASHRVKLLLGLYNMKFPIVSKDSLIEAESTPLVSYGNVLYLKSHQGNSVGMTLDDKNYHTPCIYRINQFLKSGIPLISDKKGDKIIVNAEAAKTITMELVDFMFEPVILKSPMFITIKIKMIENESNLF